MTLGEFREWTKRLPDGAVLMYPSGYKGCSLTAFERRECWLCAESQTGDLAVVLNPGDDYDGRLPEKT